MKSKKVAALLLAMSLAVSGSVLYAAPVFAGTITTVAAETEAGENGFILDLAAKGIDASNATKAVVTVKITDLSEGAGGCIVTNSSAKNWSAVEWGNDGAKKAITLKNTDTADVYDIEMTFDKGDLAAPEGENGKYSQIFVQSWWGGDVEVVKAAVYNSDGSLLYETPAAAVEETTTTTTTTESSPVISEKSLTLAVGKSAKLSVTGNTGSVKWKSSKKTVAKVNKKGQVKAVAAGKAVIKAKVDGKTLKCKVKVTA